MIELYASVITGFEAVAVEEIAAKFHTSPTKGRGHDALNMIRNEIPRINWKTAVECWEIAHRKCVPGGVDSVKAKMREFVKNGAVESEAEKSFSFRVTCNRAGEKSRHNFSSMDAARTLGGIINRIFGWRPDMENFDMEVLLNIRNDMMLVMTSLNRESLFKRNVSSFGPTTMRSTMCYCMAALARPKPGDVVLDPMCGGGSIPLEAALAFPGCLFIGADIHPKALERCLQNVQYCNANLLQSDSELAFVACDAANLPFSESSIDSIVTDLPFGRKIGSVNDNRILYPRLLVEWERVVKPDGLLVVMTHDRRSWERALALHGGSWRVSSHHIVNTATNVAHLVHVGMLHHEHFAASKWGPFKDVVEMVEMCNLNEKCIQGKPRGRD
ncbi:THUMP domain protein [Teladorsagia circumcincta]|uniref:THUMP domain protein n=1 Tax=Teladorsagia circumcincta TaxID=45464 RepID=A0A2G9UC88_TELCI|nr:THUMP domain protein [Teladorsagia circumcincta]